MAAVGSFLWARSQAGLWQLRIDDIDPPRAAQGAVAAITACLDAHGLGHDGAIDYQSSHSQRYDAALQQLTDQGDLFHCVCTRATLAENGSCRGGCAEQSRPPDAETSLRIKVPEETVINIDDGVSRAETWQLGRQLNNFIVRRRDGLYAYQLAAAVDDALPAITQVVRGKDLLDSTPRQIFIRQRLGLESPQYAHLPVVTNSQGFKLSKQTGAAAVDLSRPEDNLRNALVALGQPMPPATINNAAALIDWSIAHWQPNRVPR